MNAFPSEASSRKAVPVQISLNFMPSFYHKHLGVTYGEDYYFNPGYRARIEKAETRFLYDILGRFGVGSPNPEPSPMLFIQPIDLIKLTQGAQLHCPPDATLEARGHPWEGLTPDQVGRLDAEAAARHPVMEAVLRQYGELRALYGDRADIFGIKAGVMNIHAPYTTAHQLCGESLFTLMLDDPDGARRIFAKIADIYRAIFDHLIRDMGARRPDRIQLGDCSSSLLSADLYSRVVLPANQALAADFRVTGYHSCGASTHLLKAFAHLPRLRSIELGAGTNLAAAVSAMPGVAMFPLVDPVPMRNGTPSQVGQLAAELLRDTAAAPSATLCAWSFDRETPVSNVEALYECVENWNKATLI